MTAARDLTRIGLNLMFAYLAGGLLLAVGYAITSPLIYRNQKAEKEAALRNIMPEADTVSRRGEWVSHGKLAEYYAATKGKRTIGYVIESYGKGYSGLVHVLAVADTALRLVRFDILSHTETPGLGDAVESKRFKNQFSGKDAAHLRVVKTPTPGYVEAISGATISSRAVAEDALKGALEQLTHNLATGSDHGTAELN